MKQLLLPLTVNIYLYFYEPTYSFVILNFFCKQYDVNKINYDNIIVHCVIMIAMKRIQDFGWPGLTTSARSMLSTEIVSLIPEFCCLIYSFWVMNTFHVCVGSCRWHSLLYKILNICYWWPKMHFHRKMWIGFITAIWETQIPIPGFFSWQT